MQASQSGSNEHSDDNAEPEIPLTIPDYARAWESAPRVASSVRRPSTLPDPESYHGATEPRAIFELDEEQEDGSIKTIFVVPWGCKRCKSLKQACSRARPACVRCTKAGLTCGAAVREGYQRLPHPKIGKLRKEDGATGAGKKSVTSPQTSNGDLMAGCLRPRAPRVTSPSQTPPSRLSVASASRVRRVASSGVPSLSQAPPFGPSVASGSKRPLSPGWDPVLSRKKGSAESSSRKRRARCFTAPPPQEIYAERSEFTSVGPSAQAISMAGSVSDLKWTFVKRDEKSSLEARRVDSGSSNTSTPRVWTNSLVALLTVFPELAKSKVGFSWFQSETPLLLLDANRARGHWINSTELEIDLLWDFSGHESELEHTVKSDNEDFAPRHPEMYSPENTRECGAETMGLQNSYLFPGIGCYPTYETTPALLLTLSTQMLPSNGRPQDGQYPSPDIWEYYSRWMGPDPAVTPDRPVPSAQMYPHNPHLPNNPPLPHSFAPPIGPHLHTTRPNIEPRIPLVKPSEVETLLNSQDRSIPLQLWLSHDSGLVPCGLPPEYAYVCMGLFFVSNLRRAVVQYDICATTVIVKGRVSWTVTLRWAPGGEDTLFDRDLVSLSNTGLDSVPVETTRHLRRPWWFNPTDDTALHPQDSRMQVFSFIPLDLLAEFHPSESFPRGWFCKSCGMINIQMHFRHQICQSTMCTSTRDKRIPPGKVDPLSSLRDPYQSSSLVHPTNDIPPVVVSNTITWEDGMQCWRYSVMDGVTLYHIFTGNQESLQQDATALLEGIQCEVLLRKENHSSSCFTHNTMLSHLSDGSEAEVPVGTPNCVRIAYYTLCDFVHRYGEMDKPRFGEVRVQAWVNSGFRKGNLFCARKFPVVIHCLGADVVLKFTPKGGYNDAEKSATLDEGKNRNKDENRAGSPATEPYARASQPISYDNDNQALSIPEPEENAMPIVAENTDDAIVATDTTRQCSSQDAGGIALSDSNTCPGMVFAQQRVAQRRGRKKNKVTKDRTKASVPEISMTLVHGDCVVLCGDDFECQITRTGTTILVFGFPEET